MAEASEHLTEPGQGRHSARVAALVEEQILRKKYLPVGEVNYGQQNGRFLREIMVSLAAIADVLEARL